MNSARPPIFSHGTGPPRPCSAIGKRLSALWSRLSPIRKTWPSGTVIRAKSSPVRMADVDRVVGAAVGQGLAEHRQPAIDAGRRRRARGSRRSASGAQGTLASTGIIAGGRSLARHRAAVQIDDAVDQLDRVAGQADHPLDIVGALARRGDDDDVAALGHRAPEPALPVREDVEAGADPRPAIGIFADHQPVADQQARHHRFGRDVEGLGDEASGRRARRAAARRSP